MSLQEFQTFLNSEKVYTPQEIDEVIKIVRHYFRFAYSNKKLKYFNVPCAFDIESSSFYRDSGESKNEKTAIMYVWAFGIYGLTIVGRTWEEYVSMIKTISGILDLHEGKRLIVYIHNAGYDFQFLRKWFIWEKVFSVKSRTPIYMLDDNGIEYRCSYLLSGYSLEKIGKDLKHYPVKKKVGDLDYSKIRHTKTPLTEKELTYCVNDVKVVMSYIAERINIDGSIAKIPLTKTGYVRQYCRNSCYYEEDIPRGKSFKRMKYREIINGLILEPEEYKQLKRAFQGGFTHANPFFSGKLVNDVTSYDFTSSYPTVMIAEKFPMSTGETIVIQSESDLQKNLKLYCCLFDIEFFGLQSIAWYESYISSSRCWGLKTPLINNGRIVSAEHLCTTITEQDYLIIKKFYQWDKCRIYNFRRYKKDYLPTDFIKAILTLYENKTVLKGVKGKEIDYMKSKEMLNSCYGMCVTDPVRENILYTDDWIPQDQAPKPDIEHEIKKYNHNPGRFLFYPWGVWVTAYARRNLFSGICEFNTDYIYSDTDSIKVRNENDHMSYINQYNKRIRDMLIRAVKFHGLPESVIEPSNKNGKKKCMGVWDFDGNYARFKTLGAKRYMVEYSQDERNPPDIRGEISLTVSGLNKKMAIPYLMETYGKPGIFDAFCDNLYVPEDHTGKNTHTYIDTEKRGVVVDYLGKPCEYYEKSAIHLSKQDYSMSISREYADYLIGLEPID